MKRVELYCDVCRNEVRTAREVCITTKTGYEIKRDVCEQCFQNILSFVNRRRESIEEAEAREETREQNESFF